MERWHVYMGTNHNEKEIYFGVSKEPAERIDGSHCLGYTKALAEWDCEDDDIEWKLVAAHSSQKAASAKAHLWERTYGPPEGYSVIQTAGI